MAEYVEYCTSNNKAYTIDSSGLLHVYDKNRTKMNTLLANIQCTELSRQI